MNEKNDKKEFEKKLYKKYREEMDDEEGMEEVDG